MRAVCGVFLLTLLAICGYIGAGRESVQTVSVAVSRESYILEEMSADSLQAASQQLKLEREREIALLQQVVASEAADAKTKADALAQMTGIAQRMELEAQTEAVLEEMGMSGALAVCGAQMMTIITGYENIANDADKMRMLDAVCGMTGYAAGDIKIILTKK